MSAKTAGSCPTRQTSEGTVAYAGSCGMEDEYDRLEKIKLKVKVMIKLSNDNYTPLSMHFDNRPIVGYANFCPYSINDDVTDDFIVAVAKHEILHALVSLYFIYSDETELF